MDVAFSIEILLEVEGSRGGVGNDGKRSSGRWTLYGALLLGEKFLSEAMGKGFGEGGAKNSS